MEVVYKEQTRKCQTLSSWTKENVDSLTRLIGGWERLQSLLSNHQYIVEQQVFENIAVICFIYSICKFLMQNRFFTFLNYLKLIDSFF